MGILQQVQAVIAASGTVSAAVNIDGGLVSELEVPDIVGTSLSFQTSMDGSTYQALYDSTGTLVTVTVADTHNVSVIAKQIVTNYLKVVSGSTETSGATIKVNYLPFYR